MHIPRSASLFQTYERVPDPLDVKHSYHKAKQRIEFVISSTLIAACSSSFCLGLSVTHWCRVRATSIFGVCPSQFGLWKHANRRQRLCENAKITLPWVLDGAVVALLQLSRDTSPQAWWNDADAGTA
mmetsp:Transcript_21064/g.29508  ORF Transcript_21064/g.29508 Transcript_21064/m.29508 type:complete len:127 (+) Transcript_21064:2168-2548(+)